MVLLKSRAQNSTVFPLRQDLPKSFRSMSSPFSSMPWVALQAQTEEAPQAGRVASVVSR